MGLVERIFADETPADAKALDIREPVSSIAGHSREASGIALTFHASLDGIESDWRAFEADADGTPFQAFDWLCGVASPYQNFARHAATPSYGRPRWRGPHSFLLPLAVERKGSVRRLTWLGSELCDYNAPLLAPFFDAHVTGGQFPALWRRILQVLRNDLGLSFDLIDLAKMLDTVGGQANPFMQLATRPNPSGAYAVTLTGDWESFYASKRSSSTRKTERRQLRQLGEQGERSASSMTATCVRTSAARSTCCSRRNRNPSPAWAWKTIFARPGHKDFFPRCSGEPARSCPSSAASTTSAPSSRQLQPRPYRARSILPCADQLRSR